MSTATPSTEPEVINPPDSEISQILAEHVTHTPTGLIVGNKLSFDDWQKVYKFYAALRDHTSWMIGDIILAGERYGERYAQAIDTYGKSYSTLTSIVYVCSRFPLERRIESLPFSWHEAVAPLLPAQADAILAVAVRQRVKWTRDDVRDAAAKAKGLPTRAQKEEAKRLKEESKVKSLPPAEKPPTLDGHLQVERTPEAATPATEAPQSPVSTTTAPTESKEAPKPTAAALIDLDPAAQNLARERTEAALNRFIEESNLVDWTQVQPLAAKRWLKMLIPIDDLIDVLSKKVPEMKAQ